MKILCPDCSTTVTIDETQYKRGDTATAFCPRCGAPVKGIVEYGGQDLPIKKKSTIQESGYEEAEVLNPQSQPQQPTIDHALKKAELEHKAKELELREKEMQQYHEQSKNAMREANQAQQAAFAAQQSVQYEAPSQEYMPPVNSKSKTTAGILAILLGGIGAHHFYLGNTGRGIVYLIFCWTYIPSLIALIEGISYLVKPEQEFTSKYPVR